MIYHGAEIKRDFSLKADVVVVGTGAGGAPLAARLAEAGMKVVMLEMGGWHTAADFNQREEDMAAKIQGGRALLTSEDGSMAFTFSTCVGGSTVHYWADHFRTPGDRLKLWESRFGIEGMSEEAMAPYHEELEERLNVHVAGEEVRNRNNYLVKAGAEAMGYHGEWVTQARKDCLGCGYDMMGCSYNRKMSMLVTYVPRALAAGATLFSDAAARRVLTRDGRVTGVEGEILDRASQRPRLRFRIEAPKVVLSAGALASPVIWLASDLPNPHGWVGANFLVNPGLAVYARFKEPVNYHEGIPTSYAVKGFRNAVYDGGRYVEGGWIALTNQLHPGYTAAVGPAFGGELRSFMDDYLHLGGTYSVVDDEMPGRITVRDGQPIYEYRTRGVDLLKCKDFLVKSAALLLAAGAQWVWIPDNRGTRLRDMKELERFEAEYELLPNSMIMAGPHMMGTLRMSGRREEGVVNSRCESWEVGGLYVSDASVFPTSISVDPSASIMARALLTANGILQRGN